LYKNRLIDIINLSFTCLYEKINGGLLVVENEASLQLQLSAILKIFGEQFLYTKEEVFSIELEKPVILKKGVFNKSNSSKARIDIFLSLENIKQKKITNCAIELKFFKKSNHREPNNRYDVFKDIHNLENYKEFSDFGFLLVATDHTHYVEQKKYSQDTADFDFRHGSNYKVGTVLKYRTNPPYEKPITLKNNYKFKWQTSVNGISFMLLEVKSN